MEKKPSSCFKLFKFKIKFFSENWNLNLNTGFFPLKKFEIKINEFSSSIRFFRHFHLFVFGFLQMTHIQVNEDRPAASDFLLFVFQEFRFLMHVFCGRYCGQPLYRFPYLCISCGTRWVWLRWLDWRPWCCSSPSMHSSLDERKLFRYASLLRSTTGQYVQSIDRQVGRRLRTVRQLHRNEADR